MTLPPGEAARTVSGISRRLLAAMAALLPCERRAAAGSETVADRLAAIHALVFDPQATFSVRAVLAELDGIKAVTAPESAERGEVLRLRSFVEGKGGQEEDSIRHGEEALRPDAAHPFLSLRDRVSLHYGIARLAEAAGRCETAIPHYRAVLPLLAETAPACVGPYSPAETSGSPPDGP